jgi:hypothetical protein
MRISGKVLLMLLALSGCSVHELTRTPHYAELSRSGPIVERTFLAAAVDKKGSEIAVDWQGKPLVAAFPYVVGTVFGPTEWKTHLGYPVEFGEYFVVRMDDLEQRLSLVAKTARGDFKKKSVTIEPRETRIARVGTFYTDVVTKLERFGAGFLDRSTKEPLILAYFDRPCSISGTYRKGPVLSIDIPKSGLSWLRLIVRNGTTHWVYEPNPPRDIVFAGYGVRSQRRRPT